MCGRRPVGKGCFGPALLILMFLVKDEDVMVQTAQGVASSKGD
jgi:hypothetical protein